MTTLDRHLLEKLENPKIPKSTTSFYKHHLLWCSSCFSHKRAEWDSTRFSLRAFIICGRWRSVSLFNRPTTRSDRSVAEFNLGRRGVGAAVLYSTLPSVKEERKKIRV